MRRIASMRIQINFNPQERSALDRLAQRERRNARDQAALIVRHELERLGLIQPEVTHDETRIA